MCVLPSLMCVLPLLVCVAITEVCMLPLPVCVCCHYWCLCCHHWGVCACCWCWQGHINLEEVGKRGYHIPHKGTLQVVGAPFLTQQITVIIVMTRKLITAFSTWITALLSSVVICTWRVSHAWDYLFTNKNWHYEGNVEQSGLIRTGRIFERAYLDEAHWWYVKLLIRESCASHASCNCFLWWTWVTGDGWECLVMVSDS